MPNTLRARMSAFGATLRRPRFGHHLRLQASVGRGPCRRSFGSRAWLFIRLRVLLSKKAWVDVEYLLDYTSSLNLVITSNSWSTSWKAFSSWEIEARSRVIAALRGWNIHAVYGPKDMTRRWQPVDAGHAQRYKQLLATAVDDLLDEALYQQFEDGIATARDKRCMRRRRVAQAFEEIASERFNSARQRSWEKTGFLLARAAVQLSSHQRRSSAAGSCCKVGFKGLEVWASGFGSETA